MLASVLAAAPAHADPTPPSFTATAALAYSYSSLNGFDNHDEDGPNVVVAAGYRTDPNSAIGASLAIGRESGRVVDEFENYSFSVVPIGIAAFAQGTAYDRLWGSAFLGVQLDRVDNNGTTGWDHGVLVGVEGGVDVVQFDEHRLGVYGRMQSALASDFGYTAAMFGLAYRR